MTARGIYLVGSVPRADANEVFQEVGTALGSRIKWLPDGETGERGDWIVHLERLFSDNPALMPSEELFRVHASASALRRYKLRPGLSIADLRFENLGYADIAMASFAAFSRLKAAGVIAQATRFQVDLVPAHSVLWLFLVEELHKTADPLYNEALKREIDRIAAAIPHAELAIQFDVASAVFARLERGVANPYGKDKGEMQETFNRILVNLGNHVPADIDLLYHCCYGDSNHRHVIEPTDMGDMVEFANRLSERLSRPLQLIHMPVPRDRSDDTYFAPLEKLRLRPETEVALGLVHHTDGVEGTKKRMATARKYLSEFFVATECGFGRRKPETIPELLRIHRVVADEP